ncbi:MAG TPA: Ig-like domain-containing protein [Draconibacterium sp.]|nr:Ig-like domain-containing protein [Draconibacterium sp.]
MKQLALILSVLLTFTVLQELSAQRGYFDAPYKHYEADKAGLSNGAYATVKSYAQIDLQSEASDQVCVDMTNKDATVEFTFLEPADGLVIRFSVPDGEEAIVGVYNEDAKITSLTLTSKWSWEYLWNNGDPNNVGVTNKNPRMRFDEIRYKLPEKLSKLKLVSESGNPSVDFVEMEVVPEKIAPPDGAAIYIGDGSTLQNFIDANGSKTIYIPAGVYNINSQLYFGVAKTKLQGAGMWYSQLNFTVTNASNGGLRANAKDISYADLYITSEMTTRTNGYAGIQGVYTKGSTIRNIWVEHCAVGAWIGQYVQGGIAFADGFLMSGCRFRNTYADGINLCKGTSNAIVEHCSFRNNGDDGMAIWCAEGLECINNTFRYNTAENGWRAAGAALYGGKDNKFYNLIIKDNIDVGVTITNTFPGIGFNENGMHDFHEITITGCGTYNATYNDRVGAVNIYHDLSAGRKIQNIRMYNINIDNSKCDAVRIAKSSGDGIFNMVFENVTVNATGVEYPFNNIKNDAAQRGFVVYFEKFPLGGATYCNLNYSNLGGNADGKAFFTTQKGTFRWTELTGCEAAEVTGINLSPLDTTIAGGAKFKLVPLFSPGNATNRIINYSVDDPSIVNVNYEGLVTGLAKGQATITATTLDGNFKAFSKINVSGDPIVYYKIKNRWQSTYLFDGGDRVKYTINANDDTFLWEIKDIGGKKNIMNISTGDYMNIENLLGYIECTPADTSKSSSMWLIEDTGDGFVRIKSEMNNLDFIHIENLQNQVQYGIIETTWWSAMWELEPVYVTSVADFPFERNLYIYPNPTEGDFNLSLGEFAADEKVSVSIFNLFGQKVFSDVIYLNGGASNYKVQTGKMLSPGNYIIELRGNSGISKARVIICR